MALTQNLTPEKGLIFRITHIDNVPWILANGLHCRNAGEIDPSFVPIGNFELIERRHNHPVPIPPSGSLGDYVPFYFTPYSPMMLNIKSGRGVRPRENREIVILVSSLPRISELGVASVFSDRHAYLAMANFYSDLADLDKIDFELLRSKDFKRDPNDPGKFERYQAEALIYRHVPNNALLGIGCYRDIEKAIIDRHLEDNGMELRALTRPGWYF